MRTMVSWWIPENSYDLVMARIPGEAKPHKFDNLADLREYLQEKEENGQSDDED